jgi:hypothetical protein
MILVLRGQLGCLEGVARFFFTTRPVWEFLLGQKGLKNYFGTAVAKVAA